MDDKLGSEYGEIEDGVLQLRFADSDGNVKDLNAAEMAETLQGLVEFTSRMAKDGALGDGFPPEVRIRAPREGSVILEAVFQWAAENPEGAIGSALTAGGAVGQALNAGFRRLRGQRPKGAQYLDNGNVMLTWPDDSVQEIQESAWKTLNEMKRPTKRALGKILAPMGDNVDTLELREGSPAATTGQILEQPAAVVADREVYREAVADVDEIDEQELDFTIEGVFEQIDIADGTHWRVRTMEGSRQVTMEDSAFQLKADRGQGPASTDVFELSIREERTTKNGRTTRKWAVVNARFKRKGASDDDGAAPQESAEEPTD